MPGGIPVGTLAIGKAGATNAALLAIAILANSRPELKRNCEDFVRSKRRRSGRRLWIDSWLSAGIPARMSAKRERFDESNERAAHAWRARMPALRSGLKRFPFLVFVSLGSLGDVRSAAST
jgi:hypothetical protein